MSDEINLRVQKLELGHDMLVRDGANDRTQLQESMSVISKAFIELVEIKRDFAHFIASSEANNRHHAERHDKQDALFEKMNDKLDKHDIIIPQLEETRRWILVGMGLVLSAVIVALIATVVK